MAGITPHGIHYPDGASKAKNLGPELEQMAHDIDQIYTDTTEGSILYNVVEDVAEIVVPPAVDSYLADLNPVTAYPDDTATPTTATALPITFTQRVLNDPWTDVYSDVEQATWQATGPRSAEVPLLAAAGGYLPVEVNHPLIQDAAGALVQIRHGSNADAARVNGANREFDGPAMWVGSVIPIRRRPGDMVAIVNE